MDKMFVFLATLGALLMLCQWYVFVCLRKYLFARYTSANRPIAYPVLVGLGIFNLVAVTLSFNSSWLPPDSWGRKAVSVMLFSYLGLVLLLCLEFLIVGAISQALSWKDSLVEAMHRLRFRSSLTGRDEKGYVGNPQAGEGCDPDGPRSSDNVELIHTECNLSRNPSSPPATAERKRGEVSPSRRAFLKWTAAAGVTAALGCVGKGIAQGYEGPVIEHLDYRHPLLGGLDEPITLIHITDFHFGPFMGTPELRRLVAQVNRIDGDALFMTGDMFHSAVSPVELATPILKNLRPRRFGNFAVLGNHDFYAGEHRSLDSLRGGGITVLRDRWAELRHGDVTIHLGGIDDPLGNWMWGKDFPRFRKFMSRAPRTPGVRILLSHRPSILPIAARSGIDLILAGHIHGGQIILPIGDNGRGVSVASIASSYTRGWYSQGATSMYLNRGIGLTFVPWRINCPPEIAVMCLKGQGRQHV